MTREEAIKILVRAQRGLIATAFSEYEHKMIEALEMALSDLRGPTREQVEKMKASVTDVNDDDPWCDYGHCTACGDYIMVDNFCPVCGAPFTDEAVDMVMERLEVLKSEA